MEPLTRPQPKTNRFAEIGKDLLRGVAIGVGIYIFFVIAHALVLGILG